MPGLVVLPQWNGATIRSLPRGFTISIKVKDQEKPAGFSHTAFRFRSLTVVYVHRNDNVEVTVDAAEGIAARKTIYVFVRTTPLYQVPVQGQPLDRTLSRYQKLEIEERLIPSEIKFLIELAISAVPVVGTLYDLGQLAYMVATGRDFWGDQATAADILLGGALTTVSIAIPALRQGIKARAQTAAQSAILDGAAAVANLVPQSAQSPTIDALRLLKKADQDQLARKLEEAISKGDGAAAAKAVDTAVQQALHAMDEPTRQALLDRMVKDVFTPDMASFRNTVLRVSYDFYKTSKNDQFSALEWLLRTEGKWIAEYMKQLLGAKWKSVIKEAFGLEGKRVIPLSMEMLHKYDAIIRTHGLAEYSVLQNTVRKLRGLGQHFELDHILEQRFLRRYEEWTDALPEDTALMTFIVPRNAEVAADILRVDPSSNLIQYTHDAKTDVMRQLVPHGAEHLFSVQHIADATLYALKSLGAHQSFSTQALKGDFAMLTLARAKNVDAHDIAATKGFWEAADELGMPTIRSWEELNDKLVSLEAGFPQVEKVNGVWRFAGSP